MPSTKFLFMLQMLFILCLICPSMTFASAILLSDNELDQIHGGETTAFDGLESTLEELLSLDLTKLVQWGTSTFNNLEVLNSVVVLQSNFAVAVNSSITQVNNAHVVNK